MDFFKKLFGSKETPAQTAKNRLVMALSYDRVTCQPEMLELLKNDILAVLRKYMELDEGELNMEVIHVNHEGGEPMPALIANIPIKNMRKRV